MLRARARNSAAAPELALTQETSGLSGRQLAAGVKALQVLHLDERHNQLLPSDVLCFLRAVGLNPTPDALDVKLRAMKLHHAQSITWGQLTHVWSALLRDVADEEDLLVRAFEFFDKDGNGEISIAELRTTMAELGGLLSDAEIMEFVGLMDVNDDGAIGVRRGRLHGMLNERGFDCQPQQGALSATTASLTK
ncbi:hypothetical protein MNEG_4087 [Monoraphidium neglectum]|uniref:EF-hand domain-containing protein n=1 Tax=Monoraphidium neglectum TaxID=145388 RepID=A0A0D2MM15_9CHLO|nr:hypothetical protein MNEG_4087 [Monoraphidium neglectum]KIZ03870.1 hypothetical protein MNEG_4087 [Monoraphidium neglectum]|eukprot:XP_013902889.1 hypothetical protein MNEG_4087 [Monoraphidium neglectum]